jgi:hypothetical protein
VDFPGFSVSRISTTGGFLFEDYSNDDISNIYSSDSQKQIETVIYIEDQAAEYGAKAFTLFNTPKTRITVEVPIYYLDVSLGSVVEVRSKTVFGKPGGEDLKSIKGVIVAKSFSGNILNLTLDPQSGIEDSDAIW